jgi:hypothetical protein
MKKIITLSLFIVFAINAQSQKSEIFSVEGKAIKGYDVVSFFTEGKAEKGYDSISVSWKNTTWLFASQLNATAFKQNPEKFAPQYGGYCAYGAADGHKAPTQIETWTILNDKLYFNYNLKVKDFWNKNQAELIKKADSNWVELKDKEKL